MVYNITTVNCNKIGKPEISYCSSVSLVFASKFRLKVK